MPKNREWYNRDGSLKNFYKVLGVDCSACDEVLEAAYRALMQLNHPDKGGSTRKSSLINIARDVLTKERKEYDKVLFDKDGKRIGNYEVVEKIGEGGFGVTYKGKHIILDEAVCIKHSHNISAEDEAVLLNEAKAIWNIRHHSLPAMKDIVQLEDSSIAIIMSYIPFPTLEQVIRKVEKLGAEHVSWIAERALNVMGYMHYNGVVHGDVKPGNLMIDPRSHGIALIDFGLSVIRPKKSSSFIGYTPYFAAPEQIENLSPPLPQTDFYSLGMTMIYALSGGDEDHLRRKQAPSDTPKPLKDFIGRLVQYDLKNRPRWEEENLVETLGKLRTDCFGRRRTMGAPIEGLD